METRQGHKMQMNLGAILIMEYIGKFGVLVWSHVYWLDHKEFWNWVDGGGELMLVPNP